MPNMNQTRMIMVEGPNGAGKTTLVRALAEPLRACGLRVDTLAFPTPALRTTLSERPDMPQDERTALFLADMQEHLPAALEAQPDVLLMDRGWLSTMVYDALARGLRARQRWRDNNTANHPGWRAVFHFVCDLQWRLFGTQPNDHDPMGVCAVIVPPVSVLVSQLQARFGDCWAGAEFGFTGKGADGRGRKRLAAESFAYRYCSRTTFGFRPRIYASPELAMRGLLRHGLRNRRA